MGFYDNLSGYHKYKNTQGYTNQMLLDRLAGVEVSFAGPPHMGVVGKKEAVVYTLADSRFIVYTMAGKDIEVGTVLAPQESAGKFILKELAIGAVTDAQAKDHNVANRAVDELGEIIKKLLAGKWDVTSNVSAAGKYGESVKLYMRQKVISIKDKYSICTMDEQPVYYVQGNLLGLNFSIQRSTGEQIMSVKKKLIAVLPEYTLSAGGREIGKIKKKIRLTRPEISGTVFGAEITIKGNLSGFSFEIFRNGQSVGSVDTERLTWGDCYSIEAYDPKDADLVVAIALICDNSLKGHDD